MKIPGSVLKFAATQEAQLPYLMFLDYWNHYQTKNGKTGLEYMSKREDGTTISFAEKEDQMNAALRKEIIRISGMTTFSEFAPEQWVTNPMVSWATFAVVSAMIDMILPETIIDSIGLYTDVRNIGWGDSAAFDIEPRDLFVVSKSGKAKRSGEVHKQFKGQVTIVPEMHEITVQVSLYRVLAGAESLATFVTKMIRSMETQVTLDAYDAFNTAMAALPSTTTTGLYVSGYTQDALVDLCQRVTAWNGGQKAIVVGTQRALVNVLPTDANYRYTLNDEYMTLGYVRTAFGYDVMALPQVADYKLPWKAYLSNSYLYIISPSSQKILKMVFEGSTMSNTDSTFQNANLVQNSTIWKSWGVAVATNATAGCIYLS